MSKLELNRGPTRGCPPAAPPTHGGECTKKSLPIRSFPTSKKLSGSNLREFRHYVSQLKKQGKIPKGVDARVARPYFKRGGKTLAEIVNKNHQSLTPYVPPASTKKKLLPLNRPMSVRDFPIHKHSVAEALKYFEEHADELNAMKKPEERFAIEIDKTRSLAVFENIEVLVNEYLESEGIKALFHKRQKSKEVFNKLKIVRWNQGVNEWNSGHRKRQQLSKAQRSAQFRRKKNER